jgi:hypothetical protein
MPEAMPPADDSETFEEAFRRSKDYIPWVELCVKYIFPKEDSVAGLAGRLTACQTLESQGPQLGEDLLPYYQEAASKLQDRIKEACLKNDSAFLRRLSEAADLIAEGKKGYVFLDVTGYALKAFGELWKELGHRPNRNQLRERVERLRKHDGFEDPKISPRHWERALKDISPLFPHG